MEIFVTGSVLGGDMIAFSCIFFTLLTTIGTFGRGSIIQRLHRAWDKALLSLIFGLVITVSHVLQQPDQPTIIFSIKPIILLLFYAFCITLLSLCAFKAGQSYRHTKRRRM